MNTNHWRRLCITGSKTQWNELRSLKNGKKNGNTPGAHKKKHPTKQILQNEGPKKEIEESDTSYNRCLNSRHSTEETKHWHVALKSFSAEEGDKMGERERHKQAALRKTERNFPCRFTLPSTTSRQQWLEWLAGLTLLPWTYDVTRTYHVTMDLPCYHGTALPWENEPQLKKMELNFDCLQWALA